MSDWCETQLLSSSCTQFSDKNFKILEKGLKWYHGCMYLTLELNDSIWHAAGFGGLNYLVKSKWDSFESRGRMADEGRAWDGGAGWHLHLQAKRDSRERNVPANSATALPLMSFSDQLLPISSHLFYVKNISPWIGQHILWRLHVVMSFGSRWHNCKDNWTRHLVMELVRCLL